MSALHDWLDERVDLTGIRRALLDRGVPGRLTWWHTLGSATLTVFALQIITGIVLAAYYSPSPDHAYDSIQYLDHAVALGTLLRGMHFWGANAMIVLLLAHAIRVFSMGSYKYPREANWLIGVGLFLLVMGMGFTGYLLPWDEKAYWATAVGTNIPGTVPVVGEFIVRLLRAGSKLGAATLTRFYAVHVLLLPLLIGLLILLHLALVVRNGIAPRADELEEGAPSRTSEPAYRRFYHQVYEYSKRSGHRFWPDVIGKDALVAAAVLAAIVALAAWKGAPLASPADPTASAYHPRPEWYFLPLYELLRLTPGSIEALVAVGVPTALVVAMLALPFLDRRSARSILHRPISLVALVVIVGGSGALIGIAEKNAPPSVPPEIGHPITAEQAKGWALFRTQGCLSCHAINGQGGHIGPDLAKMGIGSMHSVGWIHSFIENPKRFHPNSLMPSFEPPKMTHQEIEAIAEYLSALKGPQGPKLVPQYHDTFPGPYGPQGAVTTPPAAVPSSANAAAGSTATTAEQQPKPPTTVETAPPITAALIAAGRQVYHGQGMCQACHGDALQGTSMAPNLADSRWKNGDGSYASILEIIEKGVPATAMQPLPGSISEKQAREVAAYVWVVSQGKAHP